MGPFEPRNVPFGHDEYDLSILMRQHLLFGPFPAKFKEIANQNTVDAIEYILDQIPASVITHFSRVSRKEVSQQDNEFICKIMQLDPRDRPSAKDLLADVWFSQGKAGEVESLPAG